MQLRDLENAADLGWPAPIRRQSCGFELRRSDESSNRANSARRLGPDTADLAGVVKQVRAFYGGVGRSPQFAVTDEMPTTDRELARRGFKLVDPCLYMVRCTAEEATPAVGKGLVLTASAELDEDWLAAWARCADLPEADRSGAFAVLRSVTQPSVYVRVVDSSFRVVSVGRAVDTGRWRGLHNLATCAKHRNAGIGTIVIRALETVYNGAAQKTYLQVEIDSRAVRLYKRLGYRVAGGYHYRREVAVRG